MKTMAQRRVSMDDSFHLPNFPHMAWVDPSALPAIVSRPSLRARLECILPACPPSKGTKFTGKCTIYGIMDFWHINLPPIFFQKILIFYFEKIPAPYFSFGKNTLPSLSLYQIHVPVNFLLREKGSFSGKRGDDNFPRNKNCKDFFPEK